MTILRLIPTCVLSAALAGLAAPALAAPEQPAAAPRASAGSESADARHARQVDLPFPITPPSPGRATDSRSPQEVVGPHPFREIPLKRASTSDSLGKIPGHRLSRHAEFG